MRIRCLIATSLEANGENMLFLNGIFGLLGQITGGIIIFISVDIYHLFEEKERCSVDTCI